MYVDLDGERGDIAPEAGTRGFTLCQIPVVHHRRGQAGIVMSRDSQEYRVESLPLGTEESTAVFRRTGQILRLDVVLGLAD